MIGQVFVGGAHKRVQGVESLVAKYRELADEAFPAAAARAVNRVANTVRSRASKDISQATGLKVSSVRRRVVIRRRATKADPRAVIEITGKPLNLVEFVSGAKRPRSPRGGVTARPWGARRKFPGVFLARMPNGQVIAVKRSAAGKAGKKIRKGRWAGKSPHIEAVFGAGIVREAAQPKLEQARAEVVRERLPIELRHELRHRIAKMLVRRRRG